MFGFKRKKKPKAGSEDLLGIRDCLKDLTGTALNVYTGTVVGHLLKLGKTSEDVERAKTQLLSCLQRCVRAEILLDRQRHGREPEISEIEGLRIN